MRKFFIYILFLCSFPVIEAQSGEISTDTLPEIYLTDWKNDFIEHDSIFILDGPQNTSARLSRTLFDNTDLPVREYGQGMVAGISIRGGSPSHTQILWNGIPLNSPLNGQTDLNTIGIQLFNRLEIIKGGNSAFYGSGAMAGSIHLENPIRFHPINQIKILYTGGPGGNFTPTFSWEAASKNQYFKTAVLYQKDPNQYHLPEKKYTNFNGQIFKNDYLIDYAIRSGNYRFDFHLFNSFTDRHLPGTLTTVSDAKLVNSGNRAALHGAKRFTKGKIDLHLALVDEKYTYYNHAGNTPSGSGNSAVYYVKLSLNSQPWHKLRFFSEAEISQTAGSTDNFGQHFRTEPKLLTGLLYQINQAKIRLAVRKNFIRDYDVPLLYAIQISKKFSGKFQITSGLSSNYRIPTFNDLYWQPGGNPELAAEKNTEFEISPAWYQGAFYIKTHFFWKESRNLIKWRPQSSGFWSPVNIGRVQARGIEISARKIWEFNKLKINIKSSWTYNNVKNLSTGKQLIYTPKINGFINGQFFYGNILLGYTFRYQDHYFTDPYNTTVIYGHWLHHVSVFVNGKNVSFGFEIRNLFNQYYELMPARPMPGRTWNWTIQINLNKYKRHEKKSF